MNAAVALNLPFIETSSSSPPQAAEFMRPKLATRLQKIHGLTRKKQYGAQPMVQPFLRENPALAPAPLSMPLLNTLPNSLIAESRLPAKSKANRAKRLSSNGPLATSPTESDIRPAWRASCFRRKQTAPVSNPTPSQTSGSSHSPHSPSIPTSLDSDASNRNVVMSPPVLSPWEGSWQKQANYYPNNIFPMYSQAPGPSAPSYIASSSASTSYRSSASPTMPLSSAGPVANDLNKPFNISPEYEAVATARFHAIFHITNSSQSAIPDFTTMNMNSSYPSNLRRPQYYITYPYEELSPPTLQGSNSYLDLNSWLYEFNIDPQPTFPPYQEFNYDAVGTATSSLEGWDGRYPM